MEKNRENDEITIDLVQRKIDMAVSDEELEQRKKRVPKFKAKVKTGYLARYTALVTSAHTGGVLKIPDDLLD